MSDMPDILGPCGSPHDFAVTGSQHLAGHTPPMTIAMYRCRKCHLHSSVMHHGHWELTDFVRSESEIDELERIAK